MEELWNGFETRSFTFEGKNAYIVFPASGSANGRLAMKMIYWGAFPQAAEIDLLKKGFHLCYVDHDYRWGVDADLDRQASFVQYVTKEYGLQEKIVCIGMSCGGLTAIKFAAKYPQLVAVMYLDAPVLNFMSCPCGFGEGNPLSEDGIQEILNALGMDSISQLICYRDMPMDKLPILVENRIPVVLVAGGSDLVVPFHENGIMLKRTYEENGLEFAFFMKPECGHHPHGLEDPTQVIEFIESHI